MFGNIAVAADGFISQDKNISFKTQLYNLSPRVHIDSSILTAIFVKGLPKSVLSDDTQDDLNRKPGLLERVTKYALRKKREDKGFLSQNIGYLLFKRRVDRIENRGKDYKVKDKQRKKFLQDINRLRQLLSLS
ncbi:MAG: hypothetical protein KAJ14_15100 [Candidatus Omnitrophica bacterium]|nr:hypothetical protein [Candidatus Omnitrophota bacterium]MCK5494436.1 hypothetical protein [Candidatus Omnitrophota bacterium]